MPDKRLLAFACVLRLCGKRLKAPPIRIAASKRLVSFCFCQRSGLLAARQHCRLIICYKLRDLVVLFPVYGALDCLLNILGASFGGLPFVFEKPCALCEILHTKG